MAHSHFSTYCWVLQPGPTWSMLKHSSYMVQQDLRSTSAHSIPILALMSTSGCCSLTKGGATQTQSTILLREAAVQPIQPSALILALAVTNRDPNPVRAAHLLSSPPWPILNRRSCRCEWKLQFQGMSPYSPNPQILLSKLILSHSGWCHVSDNITHYCSDSHWWVL